MYEWHTTHIVQCSRCMNSETKVWRWSCRLSPRIIRTRSSAVNGSRFRSKWIGSVSLVLRPPASVFSHLRLLWKRSLLSRFLIAFRFSIYGKLSEVSNFSHNPWHTKRISFLFCWLATIVIQVDAGNERAIWSQMSRHNTHQIYLLYIVVVVSFRTHTDLLPIISFHHGNLMGHLTIEFKITFSNTK